MQWIAYRQHMGQRPYILFAKGIFSPKERNTVHVDVVKNADESKTYKRVGPHPTPDAPHNKQTPSNVWRSHHRACLTHLPPVRTILSLFLLTSYGAVETLFPPRLGRIKVLLRIIEEA